MASRCVLQAALAHSYDGNLRHFICGSSRSYSFDSPLRSQDLGGRSVFLASRALEIELFYTFSREGLSETANVGSFLSLQRG